MNNNFTNAGGDATSGMENSIIDNLTKIKKLLDSCKTKREKDRMFSLILLSGNYNSEAISEILRNLYQTSGKYDNKHSIQRLIVICVTAIIIAILLTFAILVKIDSATLKVFENSQGKINEGNIYTYIFSIASGGFAFLFWQIVSWIRDHKKPIEQKNELNPDLFSIQKSPR